MLLQRCIAQSPLGNLHLLAHDNTLISLTWPDRVIDTERHLHRHVGSWTTEVVDEIAGWSAALDAYFTGDFCAFSGLQRDAPGTKFQRQVWNGLCAIPTGDTYSYQQLAHTIGRPTSYRAVANANGKNPMPIVIPCHRAIGADGGIGGFSAGVARKIWLLRHEGIDRF